MRYPAAIRDFLVDSDFHGVRFWFSGSVGGVRRALWVVTVLGALAGLTYMITHRITYYYTYPTSTDLTTANNHVPVPAIAMCPPNGKFSGMPPVATVRQLSDVHLALLLKEIKVNLLVEDETIGRFVINQELQVFANYLTETSGNTSIPRSTLKQATAAYKRLRSHFKDEIDVTFLIERVKNMNASLSVPLTEGAEYVEYVKQVGMRKEYVTTCMIFINDTHIDCTEHLRQVVTDDRACLVLDNINGSALYFTDYKLNALNTIIIKLLPRLMRGTVSFRFYDREEMPAYLYGTEQETFFIKQSAVLSKVASYQYLGVPYNEPCIERTKSLCIEECLATQWECIPYYFVHVQSTKDKPRCKLSQEAMWIRDVRTCSKPCSSTCYERQFVIDSGKLGGAHVSAALPDMFSFEPSVRLVHEMSVQMPLYPAGSLFAELGGTMGLFIGASVLTLYHCVEYSGVTLWSFIRKPSQWH